MVVNSQSEQKALTPKVLHWAWIGLHRDPKDTSRWLWVDGSRPVYTHWDNDEPNSLVDGCVEMRPGKPYAGRWNDLNCHNSLRYICEKSGKSGNFWSECTCTRGTF